jgi:hypothetical protein
LSERRERAIIRWIPAIAPGLLILDATKCIAGFVGDGVHLSAKYCRPDSVSLKGIEMTS